MEGEEIAELLKKRDTQGIEQLLVHYGPLIRYVIAPILRDQRDREECLSAVSMRVWEKIQEYDSNRGSFSVWLTAVSRNMALNLARKSAEYGMSEISEIMLSTAETPEESLLRKERNQELLTALNHLSKQERTLFYRKYYYRQSTAQIASEIGATERSVEGKLYRTKKKLRRLLGGDDNA